MVEETFKQKFPELEGYGRDILMLTTGNELHIMAKDIQKYCLSKQRVREAIDINMPSDISAHASDSMALLGQVLTQIKERLGLEE